MDLECGTRAIKGASGLLGLTVADMRALLSKINGNTQGTREELCNKIKHAISENLLILDDSNNIIVNAHHELRSKSPSKSNKPIIPKLPSVRPSQSIILPSMSNIQSSNRPPSIPNIQSSNIQSSNRPPSIPNIQSSNRPPSIPNIQSSNRQPSIPNIQSSNIGSSRPNIGPSIPNIGPSIPNIGPSIPNIGPSRPNIGPSIPNIGPSRPNIGPSRPGVGPSRLNIPPLMPNIGASISKRSSRSNIGPVSANIGSSNRRERKVPLIERFRQPFPINYGKNEKGKPVAEFIQFTRSDNIHNIIGLIRHITSKPDFMNNFLSLLNIEHSICLGSSLLYSVDEKELTELVVKFPYLNRLLISLQNHSEAGINFRFSADIDPDYNKKLNFYSLMQSKEEYLEIINRCIQEKYQIIRLHVAFIIFKSPASYRITIPGNYLAHASQIIIDLISKRAFVLESSINTVPSGVYLESLKDESLEVFLQQYIDPELQVEPINFETCPAIKLQGKSGLCAVWSVYLFLLYILNPDLTRSQIYNIFNEYTQKERDLVILQFLYYISSFDLSAYPELHKYYNRPVIKTKIPIL